MTRRRRIVRRPRDLIWLLVGGAAIGLAVGALVRLLLGVPIPTPDPAGEAAATADDTRMVA